LAKIFSSAIQTQNNFQFCEICGYKTRYDNNFFSPLSFVAVFGSRIWDPESGIRDLGWVKIRIRDKHPGSTTLDSGPRMENENGVDPTPWTVLASQRIVMDIDESFRKLGEKDYLNKCDYPLPGKRICTWGGGHR
jgi:hypothetical protein